ncbi:M15 family metallopeptidase [Nocardia sp. NPDC050697]|uniref:M15 family metallopeptidase n=1 Tax=Nocardia sp. NPDC050697 TaxID=3155158 RepID=UPI0033E74583
MNFTQNGWNTIDGRDLDRSPIPGTDVVPIPGLRPGDVATVLLRVGQLFNERVAKVYNPGCWGWNAPTPIPGSNVYSNHGSGTAIDFNAPSFPWKVRKMSAAQREACRQIVRELDGVVAWGGDFATFIDEMHFEIDATPDEVAQVAKKIRGGDMTDFEDAKKLIQMIKHRDPVDEAEVKMYVGLKPNEAAGRMLDHEWKGQHDVLKVEYPALGEAHKLDKAAIADKEAARAEVSELKAENARLKAAAGEKKVTELKPGLYEVK